MEWNYQTETDIEPIHPSKNDLALLILKYFDKFKKTFYKLIFFTIFVGLSPARNKNRFLAFSPSESRR